MKDAPLQCSELNDTVVEAQLRTRQVPPPLPVKDAIKRYLQSNNRLLILVGSFDRGINCKQCFIYHVYLQVIVLGYVSLGLLGGTSILIGHICA